MASPIAAKPKRTSRKKNAEQIGDCETLSTEKSKRTTRKRAAEQNEIGDSEAAPAKKIKRTTRKKASENTISKNKRVNDENKAVASKNKTKKVQPQTSDHSDSDDERVFEVMERISRNGSAMVKLRKRFQELEQQATLTIDPDCFKCIICYERKKTTILMPCLHQHTCGPCWIIYKIQQINAMPIESVDDEEFDEASKPKCPVCRQGVDEFKEAKN